MFDGSILSHFFTHPLVSSNGFVKEIQIFRDIESSWLLNIYHIFEGSTIVCNKLPVIRNLRTSKRETSTICDNLIFCVSTWTQMKNIHFPHDFQEILTMSLLYYVYYVKGVDNFKVWICQLLA
jgi:hypothetical protein